MSLPLVDLSVILVYLLGIMVLGSWFVGKNRSGSEFMIAGSSIPGWAVGLSFFGTYLSSNTFIGVVGRAFGTNWNYFVFSLAIPFAVWVGVRYFIPFYRKSGEISAYHHLEKRFGAWARTYSVVCYLLVQLARIATITFGMAIALHGLTGWSMSSIIVVSGIMITTYTLLGGMHAVIWTDVIQSFVLISGALLLLGLILFGAPGSPAELIQYAASEGKFSLGSFAPSLAESTFWVVFLYGLFMNLKAFGFDQNFVQRYHVARSDREARKSLYLGALIYVPVSMVFFFIGTMLYSYYQVQPGLIDDLKTQSAEAIVSREGAVADGIAYGEEVESVASSLELRDIADHALPHFMTRKLPAGVAGLIIAAIMAAAMSTISTCLNSSATIFLEDIYRKYRPEPGDLETMAVLRGATLLWGMLGSMAAILMIGVESILAVWWQLTGLVAGAMLGLFLLGFISKKADSFATAVSVVVGILVLAWITLSTQVDWIPDFLRSPFHVYMGVVVATLSIFAVGVTIGSLRTRPMHR